MATIVETTDSLESEIAQVVSYQNQQYLLFGSEGCMLCLLKRKGLYSGLVKVKYNDPGLIPLNRKNDWMCWLAELAKYD